MNQNDVTPNLETVLLLRYLMRMGKLAEARMETLLEPHDLSASRLIMLQKLDEADEPISLSQLAACLTFVKSNATQLADRLEGDHLVRRAADPDDRRCTRLEITEEGRQRHLDGLQSIQPLVEKLHTLYSDEERTQLLDLLRRLESGLD